MRVLIIDDEEDTRSIFTMSLNLLGGAEVVEAESGPRGLVKAAEEKPDVIVLDLLMPEMDGTATFYGLKQNPATRHIPVIFMTVKGMFSEFDALKALGALAVIAKPFDPTTLTEQIKKILTVNGYGHVAGNGTASDASEQAAEAECADADLEETLILPIADEQPSIEIKTDVDDTKSVDTVPCTVEATSSVVGVKPANVEGLAQRKKVQVKTYPQSVTLPIKSWEQLGSVKPVPVAQRVLARKKATKLR